MAAALADWRPFDGPQHDFLASSADEALFGGAAGGGKSIALLMAATRFIERPTYRALLLRRTGPEIKRTIASTAHLYYPALGGWPTANLWHFPSGASVEFCGVEQEKDVYKYNSSEFQFIGFDELSTFTEWQYTYLASRLRGSPDIPWFIRGGTNPLGPHVDWVRRRFRYWVYKPGVRTDEYAGPYARPGQVLHVVTNDQGEESVVRRGTPHAHTRVFIPARLEDNPVLAATGYGDSLTRLDPVTRRQLRDGDWMVRAEPGTFFNREWFRKRGPVPGNVIMRVRFWDRAATEDTGKNNPDWTVGCLVALTVHGEFVVEDVKRARVEPAGAAALLTRTAEEDQKLKPPAAQILEMEGGSAGKFEAAYYIRALAGIEVRAIRPTGDKATRARPVAAQAAPPASNISLVAAPWNEAFLEELESFPSPAFHDDQVDALSGAVAYLAPHVRKSGGSSSSGKKRPLARGMGGF